MSETDLAVLSEALRRSVGLVLSPIDCDQLEARLMPVLRANRLCSLPHLALEIRRGHPTLCQDIAAAMAIHDTGFACEATLRLPFNRVLLLALYQRNKKRRHLRLWSAGCSSGQEAYSAAMLLEEEDLFRGWTIEIVATDLSQALLERARDGIYTQSEVQRGLPVSYLLQYFDQLGDQWRLRTDLRGRVAFHRHNLLDDFSQLGVFDLILCRNVLHYMDPAAGADILHRLADIAHAESGLILGPRDVMPAQGRWRPACAAAPLLFRRI